MNGKVGLYWFAFLVVLLGQGVTACQLFGGSEHLWDDQPILSGRHPLHLYHATLGAGTFQDRYTTSCYDPAFQAGYPKTPVFDGGCRPAEFVLTVFGDEHATRNYKLGVFTLCLFAPLAFAGAGWGVGLNPAGCVVAAVGGSLVWWSDPVQEMIAAGALDLLLAGVVAIPAITGLARYAQNPEPVIWCCLTLLAVVGWYAQPIVWLGLLPILLGHYFLVAPRHGLAWHLGHSGMAIFGILPNLWWLTQWAKFWWLRSPSIDDLTSWPSASTALATWSDYPALFGSGYLGWGLAILGVGGLVTMMRSELRQGAALVSVGVAMAVIVTRMAQTSPMLMELHAERAATLGVGWLVLPAAYILTRKSPWAMALAVLPLVLVMLQIQAVKPLMIGLSSDQEDLVETIKKSTTIDARILWEESDSDTPGWNWSALLPRLTDRVYLGGLDGAACVEHSFCGLRGGKLNGRNLAEWTASERQDFLTRYNIGWVVSRSPATTIWWASDPKAREVKRQRDQNTGETVVLFQMDRKLSFVLSGEATLERADRSKIILTDITPNAEGEVILSFHHQPGLRIAPSYVFQTEGTKDLHDPIPLLRLRLPGPMSRITIAWDNP